MQDAVDLSNYQVFILDLEEQKAIAMNLRAMEMSLHKDSFIEDLRAILKHPLHANSCPEIRSYDLFCSSLGGEDLGCLARNRFALIHDCGHLYVHSQVKSCGVIDCEASPRQSCFALLTSGLRRGKASRQNSKAERQRPAHLFDEAYAECLNDCFSRYKTWLKSKRRQATRLVRLSLPSHRREVRPLAREAQITGLLSIRQPCAP